MLACLPSSAPHASTAVSFVITTCLSHLALGSDGFQYFGQLFYFGRFGRVLIVFLSQVQTQVVQFAGVFVTLVAILLSEPRGDLGVSTGWVRDQQPIFMSNRVSVGHRVVHDAAPRTIRILLPHGAQIVAVSRDSRGQLMPNDGCDGSEEIDLADERITDASGLHKARPFDNEWNPMASFVQVSFQAA